MVSKDSTLKLRKYSLTALVQEWRDRALESQRSRRAVILEMAGAGAGCRALVQLVTGAGLSCIARTQARPHTV